MSSHHSLFIPKLEYMDLFRNIANFVGEIPIGKVNLPLPIGKGPI